MIRIELAARGEILLVAVVLCSTILMRQGDPPRHVVLILMRRGGKVPHRVLLFQCDEGVPPPCCALSISKRWGVFPLIVSHSFQHDEVGSPPSSKSSCSFFDTMRTPLVASFILDNKEGPLFVVSLFTFLTPPCVMHIFCN